MSDSTSPMPSTRDTTRSGWNGSRSSSRSPLPDERDRHADDADDRQRGAAARVAVHLRQDDAGHAHAPVELAGALDGVLPGHRVGDVEQIGRLHRRLDRLELRHQLVVDVQAAGGVDDHHVEPEIRASAVSAPAARATGSISPAGRAPDAACFAEHRQLLDGGRPSHVGRHQQRVPALAPSHRPSFAAVVVLPEPCRPSSRMTRGRASRPEAARVAEEREHLVADDPDDLLRRRQAAQDLLVHRPSRTRSMNALTTLKLTSASSSAIRISRRAASTVASVSRASPRSERKTSWRRVLSDSNMRQSRGPKGFKRKRLW